MRKLALISFLGLTLCASTALTACGSVDRLASIGAAPNQSGIENPTMKPGYKPVSMPMPTPKSEERLANSLWTGGSRKTFFEDQRADNVGDILTVTINIKDDANLKNETTRDRTAGEDTTAPSVLGFEGYLGKAFPDGVNPAQLLDLQTTSQHKGTGEIKREEEVNLKVAAIVSQILPNGNLVIEGRQEVRVNFENRVLQLSGIIRPEDINIDNTISYEKVAEARISYGGKGQMTDVQQPRYGQQVLDVLSPF
ncbi:MAG: flagellar basal body L-ring protein FlgH [Alphaproteobacteria bacterium]|nr:flagellar basal body L-ring protein FlgH [Alphaproteobacteria bacterium]